MSVDKADVFQAEPVEAFSAEPPRRKGWSGCLIGCLVVSLIGLVVCGGLAYLAYMRAGVWVSNVARSAVVSGIQQSDLDEDEKQRVIEQVDRVVSKYQSGEITGDDLQRIMRQLGESPLMGLILIYSIEGKYLQPSGLSDEEKLQGKRTLQRVLRGVSEEKIAWDALEPAIKHVTEPGAGDSRQLKDSVSDEELRQFLAGLKKEADAAEIPDEPYQVQVSDEFRKAIDRGLNLPESPTPEAPASPRRPPEAQPPAPPVAKPQLEAEEL